MSGNTVMMMLTDGRFPSGGHAYSAGMEQAINWDDVVDLSTMEAFVVGRVRSAVSMTAEVAAVANVAVSAVGNSATTAELLDQLDEQVSARMASRAARAVSYEQGRRWLRAVRSTWPIQLSNSLTTGVDLLSGRHSVVVLGAATAYLSVQPGDAATVALYDLVGSPVSASVRLLGLDPTNAASVIARLVSEFEPIARAAANAAVTRMTQLLVTLEPGRSDPSLASSAAEQVDLSWISWLTAPLSDLAAEAHLEREERLFAS